MDITNHPSPNFADRRNGQQADMIVLHYTAMATAADALERLCDPKHEVSAHYLIDGQGAINRLVPEEKRAWHAGAGSWGGLTDINSRSIGIELANDGQSPFAALQMDRLVDLLRDIMARHAILPQRIIGHSDMAPNRKCDPGARFDWRRLALDDCAVWPVNIDPQDADPELFSEKASQFGYPSDVDAAAVLNAFRLRFRPHVSGALDNTDMALICNLAKRFPVDRNLPNT